MYAFCVALAAYVQFNLFRLRPNGAHRLRTACAVDRCLAAGSALRLARRVISVTHPL